MSAEIPRFQASDDRAAMFAALDEAGCIVVEGMIEDKLRQDIETELKGELGGAYFSQTDNPAEFYPAKTKRLVGLMQRLPAARDLAIHPITTAMCDHHLLPNCESYQLHVASALVVGPGAREQVLHREEDPFDYFPVPRPNLVIASMVAISKFSAENGGTLLVPGSHRWAADRVAEPSEIAAAEMPEGAVLFWLGGTFHGAGSNTTDEWRSGLILSYSLGWLRQEENQYMDLSNEALADLTPELRARLGIDMHGSLGFFDPKIRNGKS